MVIRIKQCAKFETIPSIMHGTPQFDPFHQFKIGQEWRVERQKDPTAARITGSLFGTTLQWRHNERDGVSNHRRLNCLWPMNSPQSPVNSSYKMKCEVREPSPPDPPLLILGECPHRGDSSPPPPQKNSNVFISLMPCKFSNMLEQNFSYCTDKLLSKH